MGRKKEYVLLAVLCTVFLMAVAYLFQIWEEYQEADAGYAVCRMLPYNGRTGTAAREPT